MNQKTGTAAILAITVVIVSWISIFSGHPFWGFLLAALAVLFGIIGFIRAASPRVSGGILSILSIALGGVGFLLALLGIMGAILF